ncbi:MAG: hypothetical protein WBX38_17025 [Candidatus Sulfotelmatobacter sp.]
MTAIAIPYTSSGFAIAADGRQQWEHEPSRDAATRDAESDAVQKIFQIERIDATFAFTLSGDVASRDRSFDLGTEVRNQLTWLHGTRFRRARGFMDALSERVVGAIQTAKGDGRIEHYPESEITLAGYFRGAPCLVNIQFQRYGIGFRHRVIFRDLQPGAHFLTGSDLITRLVSGGDERFVQFCKPLYEDASLQAATEFAIGYVQACSSALARGLDPECRRIGGHIHAAVVTPPDRSLRATFRRWLGRGSSQTGFQWIRRPVS